MNETRIKYPRRRLIRWAMKQMIHAAFVALCDFQVLGKENLPAGGPLLVVSNHFSFIDPVAMIRSTPWQVEFLGAHNNPNAPGGLTWIAESWGRYHIFRGTGSRDALRAAEAVMKQNGVLGMFPEGGNWATVLRPPRPGTAFLAARTGARLLPLGFDGLLDIFPTLRAGKRAKAVVRIGKTFGPFSATGRGRQRRRQLDEFGHEMMSRIAELIPPEQRGHYSDDPAIREAAKGTEIYPWAETPEEW